MVQTAPGEQAGQVDDAGGVEGFHGGEFSAGGGRVANAAWRWYHVLRASLQSKLVLEYNPASWNYDDSVAVQKPIDPRNAWDMLQPNPLVWEKYQQSESVSETSY